MKRKNFVNLTPHLIVLISECGEHIEIEPSGTVARVETKLYELGTVHIDSPEFKVSYRKFGNLSGLPDVNRDARIFAPEGRTIYIVTSDVFDACGNREDVACIAEESPQLGSLIMKKCAFPEDDDCAF